ncbi:apurinic endonuclease (APN1) [Eggerthia catenaformis OT 569 = DSM 20559]|uniref:Probable endonuclease 4 n=1 Tax=Eggerthia catenaformis OT 569 = DSM 20559 TaxID=999415 RepID=M2Q312_9FIRM|nr:deoxyribonuclease IV [Eggerthia catenaformis]EMD16641.1 apurinic endonuclease (APN1) [Eggerthia catenaformis OT 569 = DSM 20559]
MELLIGSHVSLTGKDMLLGSVKEALSYNANTFMFYTGAPQNTKRKPVSRMKIQEALALMKENGIDKNNIVVHAPYIINLANTLKKETYELAVSFLREEIQRVEEIGMRRLVLHPGSHVKAGEEAGINSIISGLNDVLTENQNVVVCLETMAGKGSELGISIDQLAYIIDHVFYKDKLGICLDTCHLNDAGYDLSLFDEILDEIDQKIGLDKVLVVHVNDSKNPRGAHKDRHENIGYGTIGFDILNAIVHNKRLENVPKILETPYIDNKAPYKEEIQMFRTQIFNSDLKKMS